MLRGQRSAFRLTVTIIAVLILTGAFYQRATYNLSRIDYRNSNFVFFWLAGRMVLAGQNPYDSALWLAAHDANEVSWRPNLIFPYPLPLALLLAPLGSLRLADAYLLWQLLSQVLIAAVCWTLLSRREDPRHQRLLVPLVLFLLFFGPVLVSLQIGALGAITLTAILVTIVALDHERGFLAGLVVSFTLLKPPQGLPIVALLGVWMLARRDWKALAGTAFGALALMFAGMLLDAGWLSKFASAGQAVMHRTLGVQSNTFGVAYHVCAGRVNCMWQLGSAAAVMILAGAAVYLWRHRADLGPWEALSLILPASFTSTLYLWSYDQILYIIPLVWIIVRLVDRTRSYVAGFAFLVAVTIVAFLAMVHQATTRSDLASLLTTLIVAAGCLVLMTSRIAPNIQEPPR